MTNIVLSLFVDSVHIKSVTHKENIRFITIWLFDDAIDSCSDQLCPGIVLLLSLKDFCVTPHRALF